MAKKSDAVTRWWRSISLRAKVTGVVVGVLAIGLLATGVGTSVFLRNTLIQNLDGQLEQLAAANVASGLLEIDPSTRAVTKKDDAPPTDYFMALYDPQGELVGQAGGSGQKPLLPESWSLQRTTIQGTSPFLLEGADSDAPFHASVGPQEFVGIVGQYTQMVVLPLAPVNRIVTTFLGIYSILALITLVSAALLTRYVVTLTFRGLGQVEATAMSIAGGDFTQRMTEIEPRTEVGKLKLAINTMLNRIDAAIAQRESTVRQMRRFIGDASHELRTPLVSVRGYAELYRMGAIRGDDDTAQAMERIEKEAIRMGVLVEDLLALARLDEQRDVEIAPVDLRPVARDIALDLGVVAPQRTVTVIDTTVAADAVAPPQPAPAAGGDAPRRRVPTTTSAIARASATTLSLLRRKPRPPAPPHAGETAEPPPTTAPLELPAPAAVTPPIVQGDENRIRQVVTNLVSNARRYTPDELPIDLAVGVDARAGVGWIAVVDHGEGIPDPLKEQIFQRFWRADTSRTRETGGSGLGLSIVASIVEALHGSVDVLDTPGGGATFRVSFPLAVERDAADHLFIDTQPLPRLALE
ncbi:MAG: HAMP domain-containing sensor histidine kinase [Microbacterium sp.]|uniref:sensor histidine kinase n=1 Tax=Microbacterium sp. TaxID=51671 RepID=UPI0039E2819A